MESLLGLCILVSTALRLPFVLIIGVSLFLVLPSVAGVRLVLGVPLV